MTKFMLKIVIFQHRDRNLQFTSLYFNGGLRARDKYAQNENILKFQKIAKQ